MPIYEYKCANCGTVSEFLEGITSEKTRLCCPTCGSGKLTKLLSRSFIAKSGSGSSPRAGKTCCGRDERCDAPPCSESGICRK